MVACFAAVFAALFTAHQVADHWVQTPRQAVVKSAPGWAGRVACAAHTGTYTATALVVLVVTCWVVGLHLPVWRVVVGLVVSAVSHYWADRRSTLAGLVEVLDRHGMAGKRDYYHQGGAYALDQSWHVGWLWVAALVIAGGAG